MEATCSSKTSTNFYQTTRYYIPEVTLFYFWVVTPYVEEIITEKQHEFQYDRFIKPTDGIVCIRQILKEELECSGTVN
jgi:hypothetical protein